MVEIIAEIASAHEGELEQLFQLIDAAKASGADALKLQIFRAEALAVRNHPLYDVYQELEFNEHEWEQVMAYAHKYQLTVLADIFDSWGLGIMEKYGAQGYKLHPTVLWEEELLAAVAATGKPIYLGVGGFSFTQIDKVLKALTENGAREISLIHGFQSYPTKLEDTNLLRMIALKERFGFPVGFADHVDADSQLALMLPLVAIGCGADVIEKHLTLDRSRKGLDYYSSLNPDEFSMMVNMVRDIEKALGSKSAMAEAEQKYIESVAMRIVAARPIKAGDLITREKIAFKRLGEEKGLLPNEKEKVLHQIAKQNIDSDEPVTPDKVKPVRSGVFIAVRMKSSRLPQKAIIKIEGKTIIEHLIERVKTVTVPNEIVLCTSTHPDDAVLIEIAKQAGVKYFAGSEEDVMERYLEAARQEGVDIIGRATGDNPLTDPELIDKAITHLIATDSDYVTTTGMPLGTGCEVYTANALEKAQSHVIDPNYSEYMSLYFWNNPEVFRMQELECDESVKRPDYRLTVDEAADVELMKEIYQRLYKGGRIFPLKEVVELLDANPDLVEINKQVGVVWRDDEELINFLNKITRFRQE